MKLTVRDVAKLLRVSEKIVVRWIHKEELPAYQMNGQFRINQTELLEWAASRQIPIPSDAFRSDGPMPSGHGLADALLAGGIFFDVTGQDRETVLRAIVHLMNLPGDFDRDNLCEILLARETLASTAIGDGIAIPHVRNPLIVPVLSPAVTLCFLKTPIDFGSLDGRPVHTLFTVVSPTVRQHLFLLSRLAFSLRDPDFQNAVARRLPASDVLASVRRVESRFSSTSDKKMEPDT